MSRRPALQGLLVFACFASSCTCQFDRSSIGPADGASGCEGCLVDDTCLPVDEQTSTACGNAGEACDNCASRRLSCVEGRCLAPRAVVSLSASLNHTCVVDVQGSVWCWGDGQFGGLDGEVQAIVSAPQLVAANGSFSKVAAGSSFHNFTLAIRDDGSLFTWGSNRDSALGRPGASTSIGPIAGMDWSSAAAGLYHGCAIDGAGQVFCWGLSMRGEVGTGDAEVPAPTMVDLGGDVAVQLVAREHTCAIAGPAATRWCWGANESGQLGLGDLEDRAEPTVADAGWDFLAAGSAHSCGIRDGSALCWGNATDGRLGVEAVADPTLPVALDGTDWSWIAAGGAHSCGVRDAVLYCWGDNSRGQLGVEGAASSEPLPVALALPERVERVELGRDHGCAVTEEGLLYCWGDDMGNGSIGHGSLAPAPLPIPIELE